MTMYAQQLFEWKIVLVNATHITPSESILISREKNDMQRRKLVRKAEVLLKRGGLAVTGSFQTRHLHFRPETALSA